MATGRPSELELQVLSVLWRAGPSSVREVLESIPDGRKRSYTTILTVLQVMEGKKLVTHRSQGRAHVYRAAVTRKQVLGPLLKNLVSRVFAGSTADAVQHLLSENDTSEEELREIQGLIRDARARKRSGSRTRRTGS